MGASLIANATSVVGNILFAQEDEGFIGSVPFFIIGAVVILGLGGLLFYMRSKQGDE